MSTVRAVVLSAAVSFAASSAASALTVADLARAPGFATQADVVLGDEIAPGRSPARVRAAAEDYFNYDAVITLGALALAGGALAALGSAAARRKSAEEAQQPAWRESVMRAVQADLAHFTDTFRRAA